MMAIHIVHFVSVLLYLLTTWRQISVIACHLSSSTQVQTPVLAEPHISTTQRQGNANVPHTSLKIRRQTHANAVLPSLTTRQVKAVDVLSHFYTINSLIPALASLLSSSTLPRIAATAHHPEYMTQASKTAHVLTL